MSDDTLSKHEEGFVFIANEILRKCKINGEFIGDLSQCSDSFFVAVYEGILGEPLAGIVPEAVSHEDKLHNCLRVIDGLSCDVLNVDLSHITAKDVVDGDRSSIQNLLEIFKELLDFILDVDQEIFDDDEENDSNLLSCDHEVISDVLNQELRYEERTIETPSVISMIPKWNKNVVSSCCESNSTDEIIRESEIIEQQLAREYPSLHKAREFEEVKEQHKIRGREKIEDKTNEVEDKTEREKTRLKATNDGKMSNVKHTARRVEHRKDNFSFDVEEMGLMTDEGNRLGGELGGLRDAMGPHGVSRDARLSRDGMGSQGVSRDAMGSHGVSRDVMGSHGVFGNAMGSQGISRDVIGSQGVSRYAVGSHGASRDDMGLQGVSRDAMESHRVSRDTMGSDGVYRDAMESHGVSRDTIGSQGVSRDTRSVGHVTGLYNRGEQGAVRDTRRKDSMGIQGALRDTGVEQQTMDRECNRTRPSEEQHGTMRDMKDTLNSETLGYNGENGEFRDIRQVDFRDHKATKSRGEKGKTRSKGRTIENDENNGAVRDTHDLLTAKLSREERKSVRNKVEKKNRLKEGKENQWNENTDDRLYGGTKQTTYERTLNNAPSRLDEGLRKDVDIRSSITHNKHAFEVGERDRSQSGSHGINRAQSGSHRINRAQSGSHGIERKQSESVLRQGGRKYNNERSTKENVQGDSDTSSGVLWDDQISPLDASESKMTFDKIGLNKGEGKKMEKLKKDKNESSVFRHYHHHYHHPHGSSEDLVGEYTTERCEDERPRSKTSNRTMFGKSWSRNERSVKFNDNVDMITSRLERLKKDMDNDEREQGDRRVLLKSSYGEHLDYLNNERKKIEVNPVPKTGTKPKPARLKRAARRLSRDKAQAVYGKTTTGRKARFPSSKARKRSTSCSPKIQQRKKCAKQLEKRDVILPTMLDEFPFLHLSPHTMQTMRKKQSDQLKTLSTVKQTKTQQVMEDAEKRQQTLLKILRKDLLHNQRMREQKERNEQERSIKSKIREKRQASARARRYYEDYQLRMRARLLKRRTREEQIFKNLFQDGLSIQKQRVNELRTYAKEQRELRAEKQQNELESLENYYRDQYSILAETISREKEALQVREKAQEKVIHQMQRNLREKLQKEVCDIQETLVRDEDDAYFRQLDAERLRKQMQMTAFQNLS